MRSCLRLGFGLALTAWAWWAGNVSASLASVVRSHPRTGKLVRMTVVGNHRGLEDAVDRIAARYALRPELVHSGIREECNYNPNAISPTGARGLMQLIPDTARRFGVADTFDPVEDLQGGAKYLKYRLNLDHDDYSLTLAAYNAFEQSVARYGGVPPFPETQKYVVRVGKPFEQTLKSENKSQKPAGKAAAAPDGAGHIQEVVLPDGRVGYVLREPL
jgi:soluble lytic murein transglycosylase-like protein